MYLNNLNSRILYGQNVCKGDPEVPRGDSEVPKGSRGTASERKLTRELKRKL